VVFRDPGTLDGEVVHLHLEHRLVQRLLGRFISQGFVNHELTRACVCRTDDPVPKVIVLGRLSLYGERASRLHDEIVAVAAEWIDPEARGRGKLRPLTETEKQSVLEELENCLASPRLREVTPALRDKFKDYAPIDVEDLLPHLERRARSLADSAIRKLTGRGEKEAQEMRKLLEEQRERIRKEQEKYDTDARQLELFGGEELRQVESDRRHWRNRIEQLAEEIEKEPARIQRAYEVKAQRVEPVGLVYLWPVSN
jgi:hypothetical protein